MYEFTSSSDVITRILSKPDQRDIFLLFCASEFSLENAACALCIAQYRAFPSIRKAQAIHEVFFKGTASLLEVNVSKKSCTALEEKLEKLDKTQRVSYQWFTSEWKGLFNDIEREINTNLGDTYSRFILQMGEKKSGKDYSDTLLGLWWNGGKRKPVTATFSDVVDPQNRRQARTNARNNFRSLFVAKQESKLFLKPGEDAEWYSAFLEGKRPALSSDARAAFDKLTDAGFNVYDWAWGPFNYIRRS